MSDFWLYQGDCVEVMRSWPEASVDAVVCDPPYGLEFMGKEFDKLGEGAAQQAWHEAWAREAFRVLKPGGHLLAFGGTRTYHRLACAVEDAGFEIRDSLMWLYGSGFPKSRSISKDLDGDLRPVFGTHEAPGFAKANVVHGAQRRTTTTFNKYAPDPVTDAAKAWEGWGTALKPAHEPIILARKPLAGTVAANVQKWGTGALNIDGCRIEYQSDTDKASATPQGACTAKSGALAGGVQNNNARAEFERPELKGRWPANVMLDEEAAALLDAQSGISRSASTSGVVRRGRSGGIMGAVGKLRDGRPEGHNDSGGASRFFYVAKTSRRERDHGLDAFPARSAGEATDREDGTAGLNSPRAGAGRTGGAKNIHPTVKPVELMRYLCRLVTPPGGIVLDPFVGSGSTGMAARLEGFRFIGVDREAEYLQIAYARISAALSFK